MSRIVLVRHGETVWHGENRYAGSSDIALTPRGHQQAIGLAVWARGAGLTHLYVSSMQRARATAEPVARETGFDAHVDERLRELDFGQAEGRTAAELRLQFPSEFAAFLRDPAAHFLPGGEDPAAAVLRARAALEEIAETCGQTARVLIVAHNTLIRLLLCQLLNVPLGRYRTLFPVLDNAAITEIELTGRTTSLLQFNAPLR